MSRLSFSISKAVPNMRSSSTIKPAICLSARLSQQRMPRQKTSTPKTKTTTMTKPLKFTPKGNVRTKDSAKEQDAVISSCRRSNRRCSAPSNVSEKAVTKTTHSRSSSASTASKHRWARRAATFWSSMSHHRGICCNANASSILRIVGAPRQGSTLRRDLSISSKVSRNAEQKLPCFTTL